MIEVAYGAALQENGLLVEGYRTAAGAGRRMEGK